MKSPDKVKTRRESPAEKPVSLRPLKVEEAVASLLKVKPGEKGAATQGMGRHTHHGRQK